MVAKETFHSGLRPVRTDSLLHPLRFQQRTPVPAPSELPNVQKAGEPIKNTSCPATGKSPNALQTYQELIPPESSFPTRPPRESP